MSPFPAATRYCGLAKGCTRPEKCLQKMLSSSSRGDRWQQKVDHRWKTRSGAVVVGETPPPTLSITPDG